jgi:predicted negative regulator of RcsB-dependent stress response
MMSLDLEEQEQRDALMAWWAKWGNLITWSLIVVLGAVAAYRGYEWYQRDQASKASVIYDELSRAVEAKDLPKVERVFADLKEKFPRTAYGQMAALATARAQYDYGKKIESEASLRWAVQNSVDKEYVSLAKLRLAGHLLEQKKYDEVMTLSAATADEFAPLFADRRGDALLGLGKRDEARAEFQKAFDALDKSVAYRETIELKLNALGGAKS